MIKISIIIPVYNAELVISDCLESIMAQKLKNIEIICVDDGSTDNSVKIIEEIKQKNNEIKLLKQKNSGAGSARNFGMKMAKGEYIGFVDADDHISKNMYLKMYDLAKKHKNDIVFCKANSWKENILIDKGYLPINDKTKIFNNKELKTEIIPYLFSTETPSGNQTIARQMWTGLFKKELLDLNNIRFTEHKNGQDFIFTLSSLCVAQKVMYLNEGLYNYITENQNTLSKKYNPHRFQIFLQLWQELSTILQLNNISIDDKFKKMQKRDVFFILRTIVKSESLLFFEKIEEMKKTIDQSRNLNIYDNIKVHEIKSSVDLLYFFINKKMTIILFIIIKLKF